MNKSMVKSRPGILMVANYSNQTGYAWNNIFRLFEQLAFESQKYGIAAWVSFERFEPPLTWEHAHIFEGVLELPPLPKGVRELLVWVRSIRAHGIRYLYLTDQPSRSFYYAVFRLAGIRAIIVHSRVSVADPNPAIPERGFLGFMKWIACRIPFIQATRVYAVSDFVRNRLVVKAKLPSERVVTILNGVDLERFAPCKTKDQSGYVRIFCGGRATVYKGIGVLIKAAALLRDKFGLTDFEVVYAGEGPDLPVFEELVQDLNLSERFKFLGEMPSTEAQVKNADIVVFPSIWGDACPSAVSEALAAGKPLVATRVGGVPELVGEDGSAIMVEPGDIALLAEAVARLIENPRERKALAERARQRAEQALDQRRYYAEVRRQLISDIGLPAFSKGGAASITLSGSEAKLHRNPRG